LKRFPTDLTHFSFSCGNIGQLQCLAVIPIIANDSISLNLDGIIRLSPLRRNLTVDAKVDYFAFYVPHRHIYGQDWIDFIKDGTKETETFTGVTVTTDRVSYLGDYDVGDIIPLWVVGGYNRIWNRYFRSPSDPNERADTYLPSGTSERNFGFRCGPLPVPWSTGVNAAVAEADRLVDVTSDQFDIVDLEQVKATYRTEVDRNYFGERYNDLMGQAFGTRVNTDADERPTLVAHSSSWLSGYDVDGTGDAVLGEYAGKSMGQAAFGFGRKWFPEHGSLFVMALPRFPTIHVKERPFLNHLVNFGYSEMSGDPEIVGVQPPADIVASQYFSDGGGSDVLGVGPWGQWYRYHPSTVHRQYHNLDGFTFIDTTPTDENSAWYIQSDEYDEVFQSTQLANWQTQARLDISALRIVPPARRSLYVGG